MHANVDVTNGRGETALHAVIRDGKEHTIQSLINDGADVNASDLDGITPLMRAAKGSISPIDIACHLLSNDANINTKDIRNRTALHHAAERGNILLVWELCMSGADRYAKNLDGLTPDQCTGHGLIARLIKRWPQRTL